MVTTDPPSVPPEKYATPPPLPQAIKNYDP